MNSMPFILVYLQSYLFEALISCIAIISIFFFIFVVKFIFRKFSSFSYNPDLPFHGLKRNEIGVNKNYKLKPIYIKLISVFVPNNYVFLEA